MKKKIKIVAHGTQWIDPNPAPVIICPECGSEKLINTYNLDRCYKDFLLVYLEREGDCRECKDCGCIFEIGSKIKVKKKPVWIAFTIFVISLIITIILMSFITNYATAEEAPTLLTLGLLGSMLSTLVSFAIWLVVL
jgi:hypothetical protein